MCISIYDTTSVCLHLLMQFIFLLVILRVVQNASATNTTTTTTSTATSTITITTATTTTTTSPAAHLPPDSSIHLATQSVRMSHVDRVVKMAPA
jgi:hypothetical protein